MFKENYRYTKNGGYGSIQDRKTTRFVFSLNVFMKFFKNCTGL